MRGSKWRQLRSCISAFLKVLLGKCVYVGQLPELNVLYYPGEKFTHCHDYQRILLVFYHLFQDVLVLSGRLYFFVNSIQFNCILNFKRKTETT